jgi:hypothetical protein
MFTGVVLLMCLCELVMRAIRTCRFGWLSDPFIAQGRTVTHRLGAQQVDLKWLAPYTVTRVLMARCS